MRTLLGVAGARMYFSCKPLWLLHTVRVQLQPRASRRWKPEPAAVAPFSAAWPRARPAHNTSPEIGPPQAASP